MKYRRPVALAVEALEHRLCPSITATLHKGVLTVNGTATTSLVVKEIAAGSIEIDDGAKVLYGKGGANPGFTGVNSIKLDLTAPNKVNVDLGGNTLAGFLSAKLGNGTNSLNVLDGTVSGRVTITGGTGADAVTFGDSTGKTTLKVGRDTSVNLGGQTGDTLVVQTGVTISKELEASAAVVTISGGSTVGELEASAGMVTLKAGSTVTHEVEISGGNAGTVVDVEGKIGGELEVSANRKLGNQTVGSKLTIGATANIGGDVEFESARSNAKASTLTTAAGSVIGGNLEFRGTGQGDTVTIGGAVGTATHGGKVDLDLGAGNNQVTFSKSSVIARAVDVDFGNGNNTLIVAGTIGQAGSTKTVLDVSAGNGANTMTVMGTAVINGNTKVNVGTGANTLDLRDKATFGGTVTATAKVAGATPVSKLIISTTTQTALDGKLVTKGFTITTKTPNP
jgi:hypothetical protein